MQPPPPPAEVAQPPTRQIIQYVEREPSMSSLKVRAEKEKELAEAESYWRERIHKLEHEVRQLRYLCVRWIESLLIDRIVQNVNLNCVLIVRPLKA